MTLTRADILVLYTVIDGCIRNPGKFSGEPIYVPYLYSQEPNEQHETRSGGTWMQFIIEAEDRILFPEIPEEVTEIRLYESTDGYVQEVEWTVPEQMIT